MQYVTYIIVGLIPAITAILISYYFLKKSNEREFTTLSLNLRKENQKYYLEPRTEAYQRLVLLMERINPNNMVMRLKPDNKNATLFQTELLNNIRSEYDHNVAQQLFVSEKVWDMIKKSKEETIKIINIAGQDLPSEATAFELANKIFEIVSNLDELPTEIATKALKKEFQKQF